MAAIFLAACRSAGVVAGSLCLVYPCRSLPSFSIPCSVFACLLLRSFCVYLLLGFLAFSSIFYLVEFCALDFHFAGSVREVREARETESAADGTGAFSLRVEEAAVRGLQRQLETTSIATHDAEECQKPKKLKDGRRERRCQCTCGVVLHGLQLSHYMSPCNIGAVQTTRFCSNSITALAFVVHNSLMMVVELRSYSTYNNCNGNRVPNCYGVPGEPASASEQPTTGTDNGPTSADYGNRSNAGARQRRPVQRIHRYKLTTFLNWRLPAVRRIVVQTTSMSDS